MARTPPETSKLNILGLCALLGAYILLFFALFSLSPSLPGVRAHFSAVPNIDTLTQLVGGTAAFTFALGCLLCSGLLDRYGYRTVYLVSVIVFGVVGASAALLNNIYGLIVSRAIIGFAAAGVLDSGLLATSRLIPENRQTRIFGLQSAIGSCSAIMILPIIGALASINWRLAFGMHAIALLFIPLVLMLPASKGLPSQRDAGQQPAPGTMKVGWLIAATAVFTGVVIFGISMFPPLFLFDLGVTNPQLLSIPPTGAVVGSAAGAALLVVVSKRPALRYSFALVMIVLAVGLLVIALSKSLWGVAAGTLIGGFGTGAFNPSLYSAATKASPENPSRALGLVNALLYGSIVLFPLAAMPISQAVGGVRSMLMCYVALGIGLALAFVLSRRDTKWN